MVKCPNCGSFSYSELTKCNGCGASLLPVTPPPSGDAKTLPLVPGEPAARQTGKDLGASSTANGAGSPTRDQEYNMGPDPAREGSEPPPVNQPLPVNLDLAFVPERREPAATTAASAPTGESVPWRQELSERVLSFRQRRARLRTEENLDFEFDRAEPKGTAEPAVERFLEFPQNSAHLDAEIASPAALESHALDSDLETRERDEEVFEIFDSPRPRAEDFEIEPAGENRLEIVVGPSEAGASTVVSPPEPEAFQVASLGGRFLAGLVDGLVLLLSGGLFAFIFAFAGGHLTPVPPNLAVLAVISVIFVWSYFGMFTALTSATPGQALMGMEARNMQGCRPETRESMLRAFGYLVSLSAFMLGFFWALVDSDSLTWHDRISGTFLTPVRQDVPGVVESKS